MQLWFLCRGNERLFITREYILLFSLSDISRLPISSDYLFYRNTPDSWCTYSGIQSDNYSHCPAFTLIFPYQIISIFDNPNNKKHPGWDAISKPAIQKKYCHFLLTSLFNSCLKFNFYPKTFKHVIIVPITNANSTPFF